MDKFTLPPPPSFSSSSSSPLTASSSSSTCSHPPPSPPSPPPTQQLPTSSSRWFAFSSLLILLLAQFLGALLFAAGFWGPPLSAFPTTPTPTPYPRPHPPSTTVSPPPPPPVFDRLIIMLVDALRSDMVFGPTSEMYFTRDLIRNGKTYSYIAHASPPTVTLPRLKALLTGMPTDYIDVLRNFDTKELLDDNIILRFRDAGKRISFYGDDTWIRLFPEVFQRFEGTTSFYVADTETVDSNVTRHVDQELKRDDWDILILHYLGLDHIGHLQGPQSSLMAPKQAEMDQVVKRIYQSCVVDRPKTLFLLCSDHGMNEMGNHGGSTDGETSAVFVFVSSVFNNTISQCPQKTGNFQSPISSFRDSPLSFTPSRVYQEDLAPTLAVLLGVPIPIKNVGFVISDLVKSRMAVSTYLDCLKENSLQLHHAFSERRSIDEFVGIELFENAQVAHAQAKLSPDDDAMAERASELYIQFGKAISQDVFFFASSVDGYMIFVGLFLLCATAITAAFICFALLKSPNESLALRDISLLNLLTTLGFVASPIFCGHLMYCSNFRHGSALCEGQVFVLFCSVLAAFLLMPVLGFHTLKCFLLALNRSCVSEFYLQWEYLLLGIGFLLHSSSFFGSSTIEEEHQIWYFLSSTLFLFFYVNAVIRKRIKVQAWSLGMICLQRVVRSWNPSGIKWREISGGSAPIYIGHYLNQDRSLSNTLALVSLFSPVFFCHFFFRKYRRRIHIWVEHAFKFLLMVCGIFVYMVKFPRYRLPQTQQVHIEWAAMIALCLLFLLSFGWRRYQRLNNASLPSLLHVTPTLFLLSFAMLCFLLHKTSNYFLFVLFGITGYGFVSISVDFQGNKNVGFDFVIARSLGLTWLGKCAFFALGNSNSIATIDLSSSYTGLLGYHPLPVGLLTGLNLFSGPAFFFLLNIIMIAKLVGPHHLRASAAFVQDSVGWGYFLCASQSIAMFLISVVVLSFRWHLFIWSVFTPKFLYEAFWMIAYQCFCCVSLVCLLFIPKRRGKIA